MAIQVLKPKYHVEECLNEIRECLEIVRWIQADVKWTDVNACRRRI